MGGVYYNEIDEWLCGKLRRNIERGYLPAGTVDDRSIADVDQVDAVQAHFFAGIGGMALGCAMAALPASFNLWTASPPCQPFSTAGQRSGLADERHLWPDFARLVRAGRPDWLLVENVDGLSSIALDSYIDDLEALQYACRPYWIPASAVGAPHKRMRLWLVGHAEGNARRVVNGERGDVAHAERLPSRERHNANQVGRRAPEAEQARLGSEPVANADGLGLEPEHEGSAVGSGERRREQAAERGAAFPPLPNDREGWRGYLAANPATEPAVRRGDDGISARVPDRVKILKGLGNAVVPQVVAGIVTEIMGYAIVEHGVGRDAPQMPHERGW